MKLALLVLLVACTKRAPQTLEQELAGARGNVDAVRAWKLSSAAWKRTVTPPYDTVYADYVRAFDAAVPALVDAIATPGDAVIRAHYAGDPALTRGQARARWALPVQYPSSLAMLGGKPIDAVFVRDGDAWRAIVGIDDIVIAKTAALGGCAQQLEALGVKACQEMAWLVADAALRADRPKLEHACSLARTQCTK